MTDPLHLWFEPLKGVVEKATPGTRRSVVLDTDHFTVVVVSDIRPIATFSDVSPLNDESMPFDAALVNNAQIQADADLFTAFDPPTASRLLSDIERGAELLSRVLESGEYMAEEYEHEKIRAYLSSLQSKENPDG